ncbi:molybdopterin-binding protein [Chenggangzhangella methanolivorans]|uniref:Molybdopterin-binding protein n=1 Tax=Chenggangzhangella methanolivorans TaxID=1437009 RepID=A0A9E6RIQ5_9HYPH|nr:molybdopterin-binding protein [Chenggangzhangella methanolivorans]QZO01732.1 molybdopterin-binding protein [Chenggangzhangella methanolivorans]
MTGGLNRRALLLGATAAVGAASLGGCDQLADTPWFSRALKAGDDANLFVQRLMLSKTTLAREYAEADISPWFKPNGTIDPVDAPYKALAANGFADFRLEVTGLVETPLRLSLDDLRGLPARTQITRHDCVEGWSCIGKWTGAPLSALLDRAGLKPEARYVVFRCADTMEEANDGSPVRYYESVDLVDAVHPQTILAYEMNGAPLSVQHGAPLRLRVERQLGYKMAKYVMVVEVVASLDGVGGGNGGYWEDNGYAWYAGI